MVNLQEDDDLENTVRISARRFEESPFISRIDDNKMIRGVYAGRFHAIYNGEDVLEKYWVLRTKALIYDVPEKPIQISGPDAQSFLQKIFSRDISTLCEGRGLYCLACTPNFVPEERCILCSTIFFLWGERWLHSLTFFWCRLLKNSFLFS